MVVKGKGGMDRGQRGLVSDMSRDVYGARFRGAHGAERRYRSVLRLAVRDPAQKP